MSKFMQYNSQNELKVLVNGIQLKRWRKKSSFVVGGQNGKQKNVSQ